MTADATTGPRTLIDRPASTSAQVAELLPRLREALSGAGPALRPIPAGAPRDPMPLAPSDDDPVDPTALAISSSGSTGAPKTVLLPASALLASAAATHDRLGGPGRWLLALPAHHVAGVQVLVRSLVSRTTPIVLDPERPFTAEAFTEAAGRLPGTVRRYTSLVPTQLVRVLDDGAATQALLRFDAVLVGGAATQADLLARARAAGARIVTTYGMSETSGGCVYDGKPLDGVRVRLDDDGRIRLAGPTLARGYLGDPDGTSRAFRTEDGVRWFVTDDAGALDGADPDGADPDGADRGDGTLRVLGRLDDVVITGGVNVAPAAVEAVLHRLPGVREAVVVGVPDQQWGQQVVAVVVGPATSDGLLDAARQAVGAELGAPAVPRRVIVLEELPLRGPGKPDRAAIAALFTGQS